MSREVRRVPARFGWPLNEVWGGYRTPEFLHEQACPDCEYGHSVPAKQFQDEWYGYVPFDPVSTGSAPFGYLHEGVQSFARRNVERSPHFYGTGQSAVDREARRLAELWDGMWLHHLGQHDVDALLENDRLWDFTNPVVDGKRVRSEYKPTPEEVNLWSLRGFGHDAFNCHIVVRARCEREGVPYVCSTCDGNGTVEKWVGQRQAAEAHEWFEPPTGEWWQLWETVSEGSPVTAAFATADELADHLHRNPRVLGPGTGHLSFAAAREWVLGDAWIPSGLSDGHGTRTGAELVEEKP